MEKTKQKNPKLNQPTHKNPNNPPLPKTTNNKKPKAP